MSFSKETDHPGMFWERAQDNLVRCLLCPHKCIIAPGRIGVCGVRLNRDGELYSLVYGKAIAASVDPIEKKPFYHFLPASDAFSIATIGCNMRCLHCQNAGISQPEVNRISNLGRDLPPEEVVARAKSSGCRTIAYTYTEPTVFFEYAYETARLATDSGLKNLFVSNAYCSPAALRKVAPWLDGANLDLKFFSDRLYREICGARLEPVLDAIKIYRELGVWIEITTLIIPSYNDDEEQLTKIAEFIAGLGPEIPWHVTAFHPAHKMTNLPATPPETLRRARKIGHSCGLHYVYTGNIRDSRGSTTYCPECGKSLLERGGFFESQRQQMQDGCCPECGTLIAGVWGD